MHKKVGNFRRKLETEAPYWSLFGHVCSVVSYKLTSKERYQVLKVG
jgi:hypothetical protein